MIHTQSIRDCRKNCYIAGSSADATGADGQETKCSSRMGSSTWENTFCRSGGVNRVLSCLARDKLALLKPHLVGVDLLLFTELETGHRPISNVYFPDCGLRLCGGQGSRCRGDRSRSHWTREHDRLGRGDGQRSIASRHLCSGQRDRSSHQRSETTRRYGAECPPTPGAFGLRLRFSSSDAQTALSHRRNIEQRLARWLLMVDDRLDGAALPLTHKLLSIMLGVHRP